MSGEEERKNGHPKIIVNLPRLGVPLRPSLRHFAAGRWQNCLPALLESCAAMCLRRLRKQGSPFAPPLACIFPSLHLTRRTRCLAARPPVRHTMTHRGLCKTVGSQKLSAKLRYISTKRTPFNSPEKVVERCSLVGATGFEPTTPCSQSRCANRTALRPEMVRSFAKPSAKIRVYGETAKGFRGENRLNGHCRSLAVRSSGVLDAGFL